MSENFFFQAFSASAILAAVIMVTRKNPVTAVIFLVVVFFSVSGMFLMLGAHYIAAINVILYGGAIMVLFLFVIMLLNLGHTKQKDLKGPLGGLLGGTIAVAFLGTLTQFFIGGSELEGLRGQNDAHLSPGLEQQDVIAVIARPLFTDYMIVLEVTGVLLLAAIVGTVFLTKKRPV
jgi:NADH-quinone oxidoreductase subunit J